MVTSRKKPASTKKTANKRSADEVLRDRADIARMRLDGRTQAEIAEWIASNRPYSLSQQQVSLDLKAVRTEWLTSSIDEYDKHRLIELARLDEEEAIVVAAWERSLKPIVRREVSETPKGPIDRRIFDEYEDGTPALRDGNPAFLARLESIRLRRCTILGFKAHQRSEDINAAIDTLLAAGYVVRLPEDEAGE